MTKDGTILEELIKISHGYDTEFDIKIHSLPTLTFDRVNYNKFMKIRRLAKKLKASTAFHVNGNLDTVNLLSHPRQYHVTYKEAFKVLDKNKLPVGCSITFRRKQ